MDTGVFETTPATLVDRELRCRGFTLTGWAVSHGVPPRVLVEMINRGRDDETGLLAELADALGVSRAALRPTGT